MALAAPVLPLALIAGGVLVTSQAPANGIQVATADQLASAIAGARGGERIVLAPGDYGDLVINQRAFAKPVTIEAGARDRSRITTLLVRGSSNLVFKGLMLGRARTAGEPAWLTLNQIAGSSGIAFADVTVRGSDDGDASNDAYGLSVKDSSNIRFTGATFRDLSKGLMLIRSKDVAVVRSHFTGLSEDGINAAACDDLLIDRNRFEDFQPQPGGHPDAIQLYTAQETKGQARIRITNNVILQGRGGGVQGIWIADPKTYGFQDVTIANNLIQSDDMWNGIGLIGVTRGTVTGNTLLSRTGDEKTLWIRIGDSSDIELSDNVFETLRVEQNVTGLRQSGNMDLSQPGQARRRPRAAHAPRTVEDLIVPGVGYRAEAAQAADPS